MTESEHPNDIDRSIRLVRDLHSGLPLKILVWGPGESAQPRWLEKRHKVIEALQSASNGSDSVYTSEELLRASGVPHGLDPGILELIHARDADVIIALVFASPDKQGGVFRELEIIGRHEDLRNKTWIFLPTDASWSVGFSAGALRYYRDSRKIRIPYAKLKQCHQLREACVSAVEEERIQRMLRKVDTIASQML